MYKKTIFTAFIVLSLTGCGSASGGAEAAQKRHIADWGRPVTQPGLPNLFEVTGDLYRGAQPTAEGLASLKSMGIKTIVNLRLNESDTEVLRENDLNLGDIKRIHFPTKPWDIRHEDVLSFLRMAIDPDHHPIFIHCRHGADRTGAMIAAYRAVVQGWSKADAIREMTEGGYGFHAVWANLPDYVRALDVAATRAEIGLDDETAGTKNL